MLLIVLSILIISINSSVMQFQVQLLWWVDICNPNSRNLCLQHWWHAEGFLSSLVCMFIYIWLFYGNRSLYVMVLGSGMVQWNISAHTSQSCQQLPSLPRISRVLLRGTSNFSLACSSILMSTCFPSYFCETNGAVQLWRCHRACWVLPGENRRCCQVRKGCVRGAFGKESADELCHVNLLGCRCGRKKNCIEIFINKHVCPFVSLQWIYCLSVLFCKVFSFSLYTLYV